MEELTARAPAESQFLKGIGINLNLARPFVELMTDELLKIYDE